MVNWRALITRIPTTVRVSRTQVYEVVYTHGFKDPAVLGETRFDPNQIAIKIGQTPREHVHTYIHEVLHAVSDAHGANLTEDQVRSLEKALYYIIKTGNIFK